MVSYDITRTNYFRVTDEEKFRKIVNGCWCGNEAEMKIWTETAPDGTKYFAFGCYGYIDGCCDPDGNECPDSNQFMEDLKTILPDGEVIIITHVGNNKMRDVYGEVDVITKEGWTYQNLDELAREIAKKKLGDENWTTKNSW